MAAQNPDSLVGQGPFHARINPAHPAVNKWHKPDLPAGNCTTRDTFLPNTEGNYTTEALNMPALDMPGSTSKDIYNSVDTVHGRPLIGQENREIRGVHPRKRKKERSGLEKVRDTVADKPGVEKGQRGYSGRREGGLAADGAEAMPPVKADERAVREGPHKTTA
ncbi:hypothetical protein H9Q69_006375 [Fusarium xylarioides]|uniref:Uncharacterized protein n=1 Tax=Fusarium xylarioides TaxID=221167 RepID=A0A9P7HW87_9HYPO|nr:hypothetical protein H9Q72_007159 [Fusarium xylarioides]KAG5794559.1 hypothetical protein H9Q69_006375 [Fusarium xylarioides]